MPREKESRLTIKRKASGLSQKKLAEIVGVTPGALCHAEKKGIRSLHLAKKYAGVLNCEDPLELIG